MFDIAVIGGGAAGMAAAVAAARKGAAVTLLEKEARVGKKLLATGNGRCNFTNIYAESSRYHGEDAAFADFANGRFSPDDNIAFFRSIGVMAKEEETGKVFPLSLQAAAVLDMFRAELDRRGVVVRTDTRVTSLKPDKNGFRLKTQGGKSLPPKR